MNVLSLFDGISCGRVALERAGIWVDNYFASEIDKFAIKTAIKNYPDTIHIGDVQQVKGSELPKIDLLIGGSPCQGFSKAGAGLNFNDPRSKLFFEYVRILEEIKPRYFLLENVKMKKEWQEVISMCLGVKPILINSALVSAQNRERLYWTNIPDVIQPEDKNIYLIDIIEDGIVDRDKSYCLDSNYYRGGNLKSYFERGRRQLVFELPTVRGGETGATFGRNRDVIDMPDSSITGAAIRNQYFRDKLELHLNVRSDGKSNALSTGYRRVNGLVRVGTVPYIGGHEYNRRVNSPIGKSPTISGNQGGHQEPKIALDDLRWRKLTPVECERLQTLPDEYTEGVSNTQRYRQLGNGWTVDVVAHIFKRICHENLPG